MKKNKFRILIAVFILMLSILACAKPTPEPTQTSEATQPPDEPATGQVEPLTGELEISQHSSFQDSYGDYYIVGELVNNTNQAVSNIELSIEIKDASGNSVLRDENDAVVPTLPFYPMLYTLASGDSTPFQFYLPSSAGVPDTYTIYIETYEPTTVDRGEIDAQNVFYYNDGAGTIYLSGELVNQSNEWVSINNLAGGMLDSNDNLVTADWSYTYATTLAPAGDQYEFDRTPFALTMPAPDIELGDWSLYWDINTIDEPYLFDVDISLTHNYFDINGAFHVIGTVANNTDQILTVKLVTGLYDSEGSVIDADYSTVPVTLAPGDSGVPFDISTFSSVNWNEDVAAAVSTFTVMVDWYNTYEPYYETVDLETADDDVQQDGSTITFSGTVTNTSGKKLNGATVLIYITDKDGNVVATNYTYLWPEGDSFAANDTLPYEVTIYGDPSIEFTEDYTWYAYVQGDIQ